MESVELDKKSLLSILDNCSIADSFKLLKLLSGSTQNPSSITWEKTCASNDLAKANLSINTLLRFLVPPGLEKKFIVLVISNSPMSSYLLKIFPMLSNAVPIVTPCFTIYFATPEVL